MTTHDQDTTSRIPEFTSREDEAAWWDSHDVTDYLDELKPVKIRFAKHLSQGIMVRLAPDGVAPIRWRD